MVFSSHRKATIAQSKVISTLIEKDFDIFLPIGDHLPFDLIAYKDNKLYRIQSKYASDGFLDKNTYWYSRNTVNKKEYKEFDFDYYGAYLPDKNVVVFPSIKFAGHTISFNIPKSPTPIYWFEDFLDFTDIANKKNYKDFGLSSKDVISSFCKKGVPHLKSRKVKRPSREELEKLVWEFPLTHLSKKFGVSDVAISKWCKTYGIIKPGRGYWKKINNTTT